MPEVVAIGETMVLFTPQEQGPLRYVHAFDKRIGGAESNVCIGVARLGRSAGWISRLGDDEFGHFVRSQIRAEGVDTSRVHFDPEAPTAVYFKEHRQLGGTRVTYYRKGSAASRLTPADLDAEYIAGAKVLLLSGITPALGESCLRTVEKALDIAHEAGVIVAFDPNVRLKLWSAEQAADTLSRLCARVDWVFPGVDEAELITGRSTPEEAAKQLLDLGATRVFLKLGAAGSLVAEGACTKRVPGFNVPRVVDPIGAGDAFCAGVLVGLLDGLSSVAAARYGNATGAFAVSVPGDIEALPERRELEAFMAAGGAAGAGDVQR